VGRLREIPRALREDPELFMSLEHVEGRCATVDELTIAHDPAYVTYVHDLVQRGGGRFDEADTVGSEGSWEAATASVGCVLEAVDMAFDGRADRSFCAVRPPGHHALAGRAMGFCLFGNVAIGAHYAQRRHDASRVLVVDWDVHHGNGTQALVERNADIRFVSMHQWPWYPGTGAADDHGPYGSVWNAPMPGGRPAAEYVDEFRRTVDRALVGFVPDLVMVSAGFDCLAGDPLGGFTLENDHIVELTQFMVDVARGHCGGRLVSALEGGYNPSRLGRACVAHLNALR
jgi:acetoin utilization deacetylase AcuC-like enzyme